MISLFMVNCDDSLYSEFVKLALCEIKIFNRKRGGEIQRIQLKDYERGIISSERSTTDKEIVSSLSEVERYFCHTMKRIECRKKFGIRIAILLTPNMVENINGIIEMRSK